MRFTYNKNTSCDLKHIYFFNAFRHVLSDKMTGTALIINNINIFVDPLRFQCPHCTIYAQAHSNITSFLNNCIKITKVFYINSTNKSTKNNQKNKKIGLITLVALTILY